MKYSVTEEVMRVWRGQTVRGPGQQGQLTVRGGLCPLGAGEGLGGYA